MRPPPNRPVLTLSTPTTASSQCHLPRQQVRHATLIRRPKRPYTFTQLLTLSDGSTFLHRTTSPTPLHRSTRDTRNTPLWNPSNARMANVESDEAGRLRAFRRRFGRAFDSSTAERGEDGAAAESPDPSTASADAASLRNAKADASGGGPAAAPGGGDVGADAASGGASAKEEGHLSQAERKARADISSAAHPSSRDIDTPTSAASKTQDESSPRGRGSGTTAASGWDDEGEDNLMDLISSYSSSGQREGGGVGPTGGAGARVITRAPAGSGGGGGGKKKKGR